MCVERGEKIMAENFNALIREALAKTPRKVYLPKLYENKLCERKLRQSRLSSNSHNWGWAYRICNAFNIPGDIAYEALLADKDLSTDNIKILIQKAPDCFLYGYAFFSLRAQQLLFTVDKLGEREKIIKEAQALTVKAKKIITFFDCLELKEQEKVMLFLRFFEMNTIEETAAKLGYTRRWAQRLQQSGLKIISESAKKYDK